MSRIYVDTRIGSKHLAQPLSVLLGQSYKVKLKEMDASDVTWIGEGPDRPVRVKVELKNISDLLQSLESGRLIEEQIPKLTENADGDVVWIVVEGLWRPITHWRKVPNPNGGKPTTQLVQMPDSGLLEIYSGMAGRRGWLKATWRKSGWRYDNLMEILIGLRTRFNINIWRTATVDETIWWLKSQISWWNKPWDEHKSGEAWCGQNLFGQLSFLRKPSIVEKVAATLTGIGEKKALPVAQHFGTIRRMIAAEAEDWVGIRSSKPTKTGRKSPPITLSQAILIQNQLDLEHKDRRR